MTRIRYYIGRSIQTVFLLWLVLTFLFFFFRLMPGDYTDLMVHRGADEATVRAFRRKWGLDEPLYVQYWNFLVHLVQGDAGTSVQYRKPVWEFVDMKIFNTMILAIPGITLGYIVGTVTGAIMGEKRGTKFEKYLIVLITLTGSFPGFFMAIVAVIVFGSWLDVFPTGGMVSSSVLVRLRDAAWWRPYLTIDFLSHYVLPVSVVALRYLIGPALVMRTSVVEVTGQDFAYFQRVSGLPYVRRLGHLSKHAILPVVTLYPVSMVRAISGLVLIELVFNWPGIGFTLIEAVNNRDVPVVQFVFFVAAAFVIVSNLAVDILYGVIDPRVSVEE